MSELKKFGGRVAQERREKSARERRDVLQSEIAEAIGTTPTSVGRWEAGLVMPKDAMLVKLAHYFGVTPAWLRYGQGPRESAEPETPAVETPTRRPYYGKERTNGAAKGAPQKKVAGEKRRPSR